MFLRNCVHMNLPNNCEQFLSDVVHLIKKRGTFHFLHNYGFLVLYVPCNLKNLRLGDAPSHTVANTLKPSNSSRSTTLQNIENIISPVKLFVGNCE